MRIFDMYCGQGGAAAGYSAAGFEVVGADLADHRRRYPYPFLQCDVTRLDPRFLATFDAVHASPPCQFGTELNSDKDRHLNLIPQTRFLLMEAEEIALKAGRRLRWQIENVRNVREHLNAPVSLTGTMFDLHVIDSRGRRFDLSRERLFECNWTLIAPPDPGPRHPVANVFGGHFRVRSGEFRTGNGTGKTVDLPGEDRAALARQLMEMPWATMKGISEAVPPAYTKFIGQQLAKVIRG